MRLPKSLGMILLAIFLILFGLSTGIGSFKLSFTGIDTIMAICAIAAGVLLLIQR